MATESRARPIPGAAGGPCSRRRRRGRPAAWLLVARLLAREDLLLDQLVARTGLSRRVTKSAITHLRVTAGVAIVGHRSWLGCEYSADRQALREILSRSLDNRPQRRVRARDG